MALLSNIQSAPGLSGLSLKFNRYKFIVLFFLQVGILNAVLRLGEESDVTLFRIVLPFFMVWFFLKNPRVFLGFFASLVVFSIFQVLSHLVNGYPFTIVQFSFSFHYIVMVFMFLVVRDLWARYPSALSGFLYWNQVLLILVLLAQVFFSLKFPNVPLRENGVNGWYWNHNDTSLALASFVMLSLYLNGIRVNKIINVLAIALISYNVSRGALAGVFVFVLLVFLQDSFSERRSKVLHFKASLVVFLMLLVVLFLLYSESLVDKVLYVVGMLGTIVRLEIGYGVIGSDQVRSMAMIYALQETIDSWFVGIGAGNSILMLASGKYPLIDVIKSIHNMPVQLVLELGLPLIMLALCMVKRMAKRSYTSLFPILVGYLLCSLTQSGGFIVNYFALVCFYVCILHKRNNAGDASVVEGRSSWGATGR